MKPISSHISFENKLFYLALLAGFIPNISLCYFLIEHESQLYQKGLLLLLTTGLILYCAISIKKRFIYQINTSTNILEALGNEDYSMRIREKSGGALGDFNHSLNSMADTFAAQNLMKKEKQILLHKVISQIDVAIIAVDNHKNINLMNPASEKLFQCRFSEIDGWPLKTLGLHTIPKECHRQVVEFTLKEQQRKVYLHVDEYFENGIKHQLIFITDIQSLLRNEERQAWQKLLRVLSHEINNSLTPISSISDTLLRILSKHPSDTESQLQSSLNEGLSVVKERAESLNGFLKGYQKLAKLPPPEKELIDLHELVSAIAPLFTAVEVTFTSIPLEVYVDKTQLKQALVNLIKNAEESTNNQFDNEIEISWECNNNNVVIKVKDKGCGINNIDNIFVPFYTTKENGCGIGLVLSRQIIMNHCGDLTLKNNSNGIGACASILLPVIKN